MQDARRDHCSILNGNAVRGEGDGMREDGGEGAVLHGLFTVTDWDDSEFRGTTAFC